LCELGGTGCGNEGSYDPQHNALLSQEKEMHDSPRGINSNRRNRRFVRRRLLSDRSSEHVCSAKKENARLNTANMIKGRSILISCGGILKYEQTPYSDA
jgi:hypothetical protein